MAVSAVSMAPTNAGKGTGWGDDSSLPLLASRETALGCSLASPAGFGLGGDSCSIRAPCTQRAAEELMAANDFLEALRELGRAAKVIQGQAVIEHGQDSLQEQVALA